MSTLGQVHDVVTRELQHTPHPAVGKVTQVVSSESMVKLRPDSIADMARYSINFVNTTFVRQLVAWHSTHVNPKELSVSPRWLGDAAKALGKLFPHMLFGFTLVQYRGEEKLQQTRPLPDVSRSISLVELNNAMRDPTNISMGEDFCRDTRNLLEAELVRTLGSTTKADSIFALLEEAESRLVLSKSLGTMKFEHKVSGKFTKEKMVSLRSAWLDHIEKTYAEAEGLKQRFGLEDEATEGDKVEEEVLVPGNFKDGKIIKSNVEKFVEAGFRVGAYVSLIRRITVGHDYHDRHDIKAGTIVPIVGFVDPEWVVCAFQVPKGSKGKTQEVEWKVPMSNLSTKVESAIAAGTDKGKLGAKFKFLVNEEGDDDNLEVVTGSENNLVINDEHAPALGVKTLASFMLDSVVKCLPKFSSDDLAIVKRGGNIEIYTLKDFKAGQIIFAPESHEIKPRHWTAGRSAICLNTNLSPSLPPMVLDGRVRASPEGKSAFALFWLVTRKAVSSAKDSKDVNMELHYTESSVNVDIKVEHNKEMNLSLDKSKVPSFPLLVNPKPVKKHVKLIVKEDADLNKLAERLEKQKIKDDAEKEAKKKDEEKGASSSSKKPKVEKDDEPPTKKAKHN